MSNSPRWQALEDRGALILCKNNVDPLGNSYGCHENYMVPRSTDWLSEFDQKRLLIRYLIPFLVTRCIYCGSGRVGFGTKLDQGTGFQLSQRADFIQSLASERTEVRRPIVSATTPVGTSKITMPAVKNALAANASAFESPASSRKIVLMPQMNEAASVLPSISAR